MNKVYLRKTEILENGLMASERLDLCVEQEPGLSSLERRCSFTFSSRIQGVADVSGHISFRPNSYEPTGLSHSSGQLTAETMKNFSALSELLRRLETLCASGMTDEQIIMDVRVQRILKDNRFKSLESYKEQS